MKEAFFDLFWEIVADFKDALPYLCRLVVAAVCGAGIGLERTLRQKEAGLRTHIIVALGSALMMIVSKYGFFDLFMYDNVKFDGSRLAANIITGVSFLGSGIIIYKGSIKGLTTAAGIWATASVGLAIGAGMYTIGIGATVILVIFKLVFHMFFQSFENTVYEFRVTLNDNPEALKTFRAMLEDNKILIEQCKMTRNKNATISLDIMIKKSRSTSMDEIMLIAEQDDDVISVEL